MFAQINVEWLTLQLFFYMTFLDTKLYYSKELEYLWN